MPTALHEAVLPHRPEMTESKARVFRAAVELFGEHGYHGVSVRDLAADLGVKPPALYAHVASKQQLLYELITIGLVEHRDRLRAALLDASSDPVEQVRALVRAHVGIHLEFPALARVSHREIGALDADQLVVLHAVRDESARMFVDVIERGVRLGAFTDVDVILAIHAIAAMGVRAAEWWSPEDGPPADTVATTFAGYALSILTH